MGTLRIDYQFQGIADRMVIYYEGAVLFDSGMISESGSFNVDYGPGFSTFLTIVMNPGNNSNTGHGLGLPADGAGRAVFVPDVYGEHELDDDPDQVCAATVRD